MSRLGAESPRSRSIAASLMTPEQLRDLSSPEPDVRDRAWTLFYPRARAIAVAKLRKQFGLRPGLDDQDADDAVDAAMGILYRRCLLAPRDNPVRQPYAMLVSISVHLLPKSWKQRRRERDLSERLARTYAEAVEPFSEATAPGEGAHAENLARWLVLQLDKARAAMPKEIRAGLLGALFHETGFASILDGVLDGLPDGRRRICRLYHVEGLTTSQIAERLGCGPSNVSNGLRRGWAALNDATAFRYALEQVADGRLGREAEAAPLPLAVAG